MTDQIFTYSKKPYKHHISFAQIDKYLSIIFKEFNKSIFKPYNIDLKMPPGLNMPNTYNVNLLNGKFKYYNGKRRDGDYYLKITINTFDSLNEKYYRDKFVTELKSKGIEMEVGDRMKLNIRTRSLLFEYRHLIKSVKTINKFKL